MAKTNTAFIPAIWAREMRFQLEDQLIGLSVVNFDYQGEIQGAGDRVRIPRPGVITVEDYVPGEDLTLQRPDGTVLEIVIDQQKGFAFGVDDIEQVQSSVDNVAGYSRKAVRAIAEAADSFVFSHYTEADADNVIAAQAIDKDNVHSVLVAAKAKLSAKGVPLDGRYAVLGAEEIAALDESGKLTQATVGGDSVVRNGFSGRAAGFEIYMSNHLAEAGGSRKCLFGTREAISFAEQIVQLSAADPTLQFGTIIKGLHVYGASVLEPTALGVIESTIA